MRKKADNKDSHKDLIINDITQLNPIEVKEVHRPKSLEDIVNIVKFSSGPICIGGGRYSMGGQTAIEKAVQIDMREFNEVVEFNKDAKTITVQTGITWYEIQQYIDIHDLSVKIMQTYSNFSVGGSLSVNVHGRYIGLGPLILSVKSIQIVLADGEVIEASPSNQHKKIFYGAIGGYGGLGIITQVTLELAENCKVSRHHKELKVEAYWDYFNEHVRHSQHVIFHNADIYPPNYKKLRSVSWYESFEPVTIEDRLIQREKSYPIERYFLWAVSETKTGKWRRQLYIDPLFYIKKKIVWRNHEASYDVAELEPSTRRFSTYVLQEYFVPVERLYEFIPKMSTILQRYKVNMMNISIRHAIADPGSLLAWANSEVFAFVMYYKEKRNGIDQNVVPIWTRELIDAVIACGGTYYLPYQIHASYEQFHKAYPKAKNYFKLKEELDPNCKFNNRLINTYMGPPPPKRSKPIASLYKEGFATTRNSDDLYLFLQNIYNVFNENKFHYLIRQMTELHDTDEEIYKAIQGKLSKIKVLLNDLWYGLPALFKQKKEMTRQTLRLVEKGTSLKGYLEIGSTGRYISDQFKAYDISEIYLCHDEAPTNSPVDIAERGRLKAYGHFIPFNDYAPISKDDIADESLDIITCYIGLHHAPKDKIDDFVKSLHRCLRKGGILILREHDVTNPFIHSFVCLIHSVFNCGLGNAWEVDSKELRHFNSVEYWEKYLSGFGFKQEGEKLLQAYDPSLNTLIKFIKQ